MTVINTELNLSDLVLPILISLAVLLLYVLVKLLLNAEKTQEENENRGAAFFHAFYLAPDFTVLSIALVISSKVIKAMLDGSSIPTKLGDSFSNYFYLLILSQVIILIITSIIWLRTHDRFKEFPVKAVPKRRSIRGIQENITIYRVKIIQGLIGSVGFKNLVIGNGLGIISIAAYVIFIYYAFF